MEMALVVPLLVLFAFGGIEFGMAWGDRLTVQTAVRAGVRVGSAQATVSTADQSLLLATGAALTDLGLTNIRYVVVYKSATTDGVVPATCLTATPHSVSGSCNAYTGAQLAQVVAGTAPASWFGCGVGSLDLSWCPTGRQAVQALNNDYLGVWVKASRPMLTGFFGTTITIADDAVMRLEPQEA